MRVTHLSDLHVGPVLAPKDLPRIVALANQLDGDLVAVTGDFVDLSLTVLEPVIHALQQLRAPLGVWLVPGNHDYLDDGPELIRRFQKAGLNLLLNRAESIKARGAPVLVAGVDFPHKKKQLGSHLVRAFHRAPRRPESALRLLLSHHPDAFDWAGRHDVDLTLSGHTHGGQLVLARTGGKRGSIGLGSLGFKYPHGLYRRDRHFLYVTSGVGSWFPLRVQCPAEIASLTLRRRAA